MADAEQIIRLAGNEDIHAVRGLLARAQAPRVMLVVPRAHPALQRAVRLKLLTRQAHEEGVRLALVTEDRELHRLAQQLDLSSFRSVEAARRAKRWRDGEVNGTSAQRSARAGANSLAWERGRQAVLERHQRDASESNWSESIMLGGVLFAMMILLAAVVLLVLPSAQITLVPRQESLNRTFSVILDPVAQEVDVFNDIVPSDLMSAPVQGTLGVSTTGRRDIPAAHATGQILFLNATGQPVTIPENSIVSTSSGSPIRFRTLSAVTLPAEPNARAATDIEAVAPGPSGNVLPLQINLVEGAAASAVRVLNEAPTEGGDVQQRAVVTAADKEQLFEQLQHLLLTQGVAELQQALQERSDEAGDVGSQPNLFIVPETISIEITAETYSASVDEQADVLNLDLRARVSAQAAEREDIERLAQRAIREDVPEGYQLINSGFNVVTGEGARDEQGYLTLPVRVDATAVAELEGDQIRRLVRGQPLDEAQVALLTQLPLAADPAIELAPEWWSRMPLLSLRIRVLTGVLAE